MQVALMDTPVQNITSLDRCSSCTVVTVFCMHSSARNGGSAITRSNECASVQRKRVTYAAKEMRKYIKIKMCA